MYNNPQINELAEGLDQMVADKRIISYNIKYEQGEWHAYLQPVVPVNHISIDINIKGDHEEGESF